MQALAARKDKKGDKHHAGHAGKNQLHRQRQRLRSPIGATGGIVVIVKCLSNRKNHLLYDTKGDFFYLSSKIIVFWGNKI